MRTVGEIYEEYRIPPWLQLHQLRVAAVGKFVTEHFHGHLQARDVIGACLLHDMGAIVKFKFRTNTPDLEALYSQEGIEYWEGVQRDFRERYGDKEHPATDAILRELQIPEAVQTLIHNTGFQNMQRVIADGNIEAQIVQYADMRVGLHAITTLEDRLADIKRRYAKPDLDWNSRMDSNLVIARDIESRLFKDMAVRPEDITEVNAASTVESLRRFPVL